MRDEMIDLSRLHRKPDLRQLLVEQSSIAHWLAHVGLDFDDAPTARSANTNRSSESMSNIGRNSVQIGFNLGRTGSHAEST